MVQNTIGLERKIVSIAKKMKGNEFHQIDRRMKIDEKEQIKIVKTGFHHKELMKKKSFPTAPRDAK